MYADGYVGRGAKRPPNAAAGDARMRTAHAVAKTRQMDPTMDDRSLNQLLDVDGAKGASAVEISDANAIVLCRRRDEHDEAILADARIGCQEHAVLTFDEQVNVGAV